MTTKNEIKQGTIHAAIMAEIHSLAVKCQKAIPANIGAEKNNLVIANSDTPTGYYLECKGFTKNDIPCTLIIAFFLDLTCNEVEVHLSFGDVSGKKIDFKKTFGFFDDMSSAVSLAKNTF